VAVAAGIAVTVAVALGADVAVGVLVEVGFAVAVGVALGSGGAVGLAVAVGALVAVGSAVGALVVNWVLHAPSRSIHASARAIYRRGEMFIVCLSLSFSTAESGSLQSAICNLQLPKG
jgi:hypothetical protein